jgi:hypothetical protein
MKTNQRKYSKLSALAAVVLASLAGLNPVQAQTYIASFDTSIAANDGVGGNVSSGATVVWDGTVNAPNGPAGGSEYVTIPFATQTGWQEMQLNFTGNHDLLSYIDVELDIKVDAAHSTINNGNYGSLYPVIQNWSGGTPGWGQLASQPITNNGTGWQHMKFQLIGVASSMNRLVIDINQGGPVTNSYWIDNIALTSAPLPPPTLASPVAAPQQPGLTFLPATTSQYQRVMVYPNAALGTGFGWYGQATAGNPVSYSFTITNFPNVGHYTAQVFWIPNATMQYTPTDTSVDWNCTNDLVFTVSANTNTPPTGWGVTMAAKTNSPGALGAGNPNLTITNFSYGSLPVGTWTITFDNNTDFTITAPDNSVRSASLPADVASIVSGNDAGNTALTAYFGIQPNNPVGIAKPAVFSNIKISGTGTTINDSFNLGYLDTTNTWSILSDNQKDVTVGTGDLLYYLSWTTPNDQGYSTLLAASSVHGPWLDLVPSAGWMTLNGSDSAMISKANLQATLGETSTAYFRLIKRVFSQLQVLFPGETNAPNTLTGKIGTPNPISLSADSGLVNVTVNAMDSTFHIVNSGDAITFSSVTDPTAITTGISLVNGTATQAIQFDATGGQTVTATDTTNTNIPAATSSSLTVGP